MITSRRAGVAPGGRRRRAASVAPPPAAPAALWRFYRGAGAGGIACYPRAHVFLLLIITTTTPISLMILRPAPLLHKTISYLLALGPSEWLRGQANYQAKATQCHKESAL